MFLLCYFVSSLKAIFGIFDGHGGREAGDFARENLWHIIKQQKWFYSEDKAQIIKAIKEGFVNVPLEVWKYRGKWTCGSCLLFDVSALCTTWLAFFNAFPGLKGKGKVSNES